MSWVRRLLCGGGALWVVMIQILFKHWIYKLMVQEYCTISRGELVYVGVKDDGQEKRNGMRWAFVVYRVAWTADPVYFGLPRAKWKFRT